jgi:hypothetical protein
VTDIPFPPESEGITPDEIPYGYSAYRNIWEDKSGYDRTAVGETTDENGRTVIMIALSPGRYVPVTMVSAGWAPGEAGSTLLDMITEAVDHPGAAGHHPRTGSARAPEQGL